MHIRGICGGQVTLGAPEVARRRCAEMQKYHKLRAPLGGRGRSDGNQRDVIPRDVTNSLAWDRNSMGVMYGIVGGEEQGPDGGFEPGYGSTSTTVGAAVR